MCVCVVEKGMWLGNKKEREKYDIVYQGEVAKVNEA